MLVLLGRLGTDLSGVEYCNSELEEVLRRSGVARRWIALSASRAHQRGRFRLTSLRVAVRGLEVLIRTTLRERSTVIYLPLSQGGVGLARDLLAIILTSVIPETRLALHLHGEFRADLAKSRRSRVSRAWAYRLAATRADCIISCVNNHTFSGRSTIYVSNTGMLARLSEDIERAGVRRRSDLDRASRRGNGLTLGYLGLVSRGKGVEQLARALESNWELRLIGPRPEADDVLAPRRTESSHTDVLESERVVLLGPLYGRAKWTEMNEWDIACFPSYSEGLPLALLEARLLGIPCVASAVGDIPTFASRDAGVILTDFSDTATVESSVQRAAMLGACRTPLPSGSYGEEILSILRDLATGQPAGARH